MIVRRVQNDELYHYGVERQKWGVRRYQNPDGSLTEEGRKRYLKGDLDSGYAMLTSTGKREIGKELTKNRKMAEALAEEKIKPNIQTLDEASKELNDNANKYAELVKSKSKELANNAEFKAKCYKHFEGIGGINEWDMEDAIMDQLREEFKSDKEMSSTLKKYTDAQDTYWGTLEKMADEIVKEIGEETIINDTEMPYVAKGRSAASRVINKSVDTQWNSYVYRHFDDYWVYDVIDNKVYDNINYDDWYKSKKAQK